MTPEFTTIRLMENPYATPRELNERLSLKQTPDLRWPRRILYFHVLAIAICGTFTLIDTGKVDMPETAQSLMAGLAVPMILSIGICPVAMCVAVFRLNGLSLLFRLLALVGEMCLSLLQAWAILPLVQ